MKKDLAVIVAVYNLEKEIEFCLKSLKKQTIKNVEFIIVDDGSTDDTSSIIKNFIQVNDDDRFVYYYKKNGGLSDARNFGLSKANSTYIMFIDGDDKLKNEEFLIKMIKCMQKNKLEVLEFNFDTLKNNKQKEFFFNRKESGIISGKELFIQSINKGRYYAYVWHYIFSLEFLKINNFSFEKGIYIEDVLFMIPILLKAKKTMFVKNIGYIYINRSNSITNKNNIKHRKDLVNDHLYVLQQLKIIIDNKDLEEKYRVRFINLLYNAYFVNVLKALGYNIEINKNEIDTFTNISELNKKNKIKSKIINLPKFILKPICKLIVKIKP